MLETLWNIFAWVGILSVISGGSLTLYALWTVFSDKLFDIGPKFVLLIAASAASSQAQTTSSVHDAAADKLYSEQLIFGDGWLSEWRASRAEARADRAEILKEVLEAKSVFNGQFKDFIESLTKLAAWCFAIVIAANILPPIVSWIPRRTVAILMLCLVPAVGFAEDPEPNIPEPNLVMFCGPSCPACEKWKLEVLPALLPKGWHILIAQGKEAPYPRFLIKRGDKWVSHVGFLTIDRLRQALEER